METDRNHRFADRNRCARRAVQEKIVADTTPPLWYRWWRFYHRINNPDYTPLSPLAS